MKNIKRRSNIQMLINKNKAEILKDPVILDQIEEKVEKRIMQPNTSEK